MNTSRETHLPNDEIDLIDMFSTLWEKKVTIFLVSLLFLLAGVFYQFITPGKYVGEIVLRGPIGAQLVSYAPLNDGVKEHYGDFLESSGQDIKAVNQFEISTDSLVRDMVRELQDYDEVESALKEHSPQVREMSDTEFESEKSRLFSKFRITPATDRNPEVRVALEWSDEDQLLDVFFTTLSLAEQNLNTEKVKFLKSLADNIERRNSAEVEKLNRALISIMETVDLKVQGKSLFLKEQAEIARELGFAENRLTEGGQDNQFSLNISLQDKDSEVPLEDGDRDGFSEVTYLRGYKSLEKELALISGRTNDQNYLLDPDYMEKKARISELKNNGDADQFRKVIDASPFASGADIFNIERDTIWVQNTRNTPFVLVFFGALGAIIGSVVVLMRNAMSGRSRKSRLQSQT